MTDRIEELKALCTGSQEIQVCILYPTYSLDSYHSLDDLPALLALVEQLEGALEDARDDLARYNETKFDCENAINKALAAVREFREGK